MRTVWSKISTSFKNSYKFCKDIFEMVKEDFWDELNLFGKIVCSLVLLAMSLVFFSLMFFVVFNVLLMSKDADKLL